MHLDFETFSEIDIKKAGAWTYAIHPSTEIICMAYALENETPELLTDPEEIREVLLAHIGKKRFQAWNSFFEMSICTHKLGLTEVLDPTLWEDTAARAAVLALPRSLGNCAAAMSLSQDKAKEKRGAYLIQRLCKPNRGKRIRDPALLSELYRYCVQDVVAERELAKRLRPLSRKERKVWELDQTINIRGVYIDINAVHDALALIDIATKQLNKEVVAITNGVLSNVSQRQRVLDYINNVLGYPLKEYSKAYLDQVLTDPMLPGTARRLLEIRQQTGRTSTAKYTALKNTTSPSDKRAHGLLMYHGASTGRWSGKHFQPQNLPRASFPNIDACIKMFRYRDPGVLEMLYDDPMDALSTCIRGMVCAPPGKKLLVADYSAIEARVLAWLAGQEDILEVFRSHGRIYEHTASRIYGTPIEKINKEQRFIGKVATLALGYQGGPNAFTRMAEAFGMDDMGHDSADAIKKEWRAKNKQIVSFWWNIESAAIDAIKYRGVVFEVRKIKFKTADGYLFCRLPSGRLLAYYRPEIVVGKFKNEQISFMGTNVVTHKWERQSTYGGKLVENITQAVARDILADAMLRIESPTYQIVLSVHDEIIAESDIDTGDVKQFEELMCTLPEWAAGLPINADSYECKRYQKL